jgi:hypothetical protein
MGALRNLATDVDKEVNGIPLIYPETDIEFTIARDTNPAFIAEVRKLTKPHLKKYRADIAYVMLVRDGTMDKINQKAAAKHLVKGWKNLQDESGAEIEYSHEKALEILSAQEYADVFRWVMIAANDQSAYALELKADSAKN